MSDLAPFPTSPSPGVLFARPLSFKRCRPHPIPCAEACRMKRSPLSWGWIGLLSALGVAAVALVSAWPWMSEAREPAKKPEKPLAATPAPFDGERAMKYLEAVCKIGPRMSGTDGM